MSAFRGEDRAIHYVLAGYVKDCLDSHLELSAAAKVIGWGKTFRITQLQMERIISSKGPKYSLAWCGALLREQHVSNHLPHRKSERIQHCNNQHKNTDEKCCEGTFNGVRWCDDDIEQFIFLHFFYLHLDIVSVTHCTVTSCGFIGQDLLSSTLVKLLNLSPPTTQKCWHARAQSLW